MSKIERIQQEIDIRTAEIEQYEESIERGEFQLSHIASLGGNEAAEMEAAEMEAFKQQVEARVAQERRFLAASRIILASAQAQLDAIQ